MASSTNTPPKTHTQRGVPSAASLPGSPLGRASRASGVVGSSISSPSEVGSECREVCHGASLPHGRAAPQVGGPRRQPAYFVSTFDGFTHFFPSFSLTFPVTVTFAFSPPPQTSSW